jgi:hypothetical protein
MMAMMSKDVKFKRLKEWFGRALDVADFDLRLHDKEKGKSWKEATPLSLFNKMMGHVNKMMDPNPRVGQVHAIKVANYALMIATRLAGDNVAVEAEPEKIVLREIIYPHAGHTESNVEFGPPIIAGKAEPEKDTIAALEELAGTITEEEAREAFPRHAKELPKGESGDEGYYCPWCNHTAKLGVGCRGKICCISCGKPIDSRFAMLLKKARQFNHIIMKKPITSAKMAEYLGTSSNWAGQVLAQLGWKSAGWRKGLGARWNPPKEDKE